MCSPPSNACMPIRRRLGICCEAAYRDKGKALVIFLFLEPAIKGFALYLMRLRQDVKAKPLLHAAKLHHVLCKA